MSQGEDRAIAIGDMHRNLLKIGYAISEIWNMRQTRAHSNIPYPNLGWVITSPGEEWELLWGGVCLFVCLSVHLHNSKTARPTSPNFSCTLRCGHVSVLLWWRCEMLCTSGFMDSHTMGPVDQNQAQGYFWTQTQLLLARSTERRS